MSFVRKIVFLVLCAIALGGCGEELSPVEKATSKQELLVGNSADPETLDPSLATGLSETKILRALFEGLVRADKKTLEVKPALAKRWTISEDGLKYVFYLDERAKWSDGTKLTASDFVFSFRRSLTPTIPAEYASLLLHIKNAQKIRSGKEKDFSKLGVKAIDNNTLQIELEKPCPYFLSLLYHTIYFPLPKHTLEKFGADKFPNAIWTKPQNIVSNGAFKLELWQINNKVRVVRNKYYRDLKSVKLNAIEFYPITNINTEDRAFRAGQLHLTDSITPHRVSSIIKQTPQNFRSDKWLGVYYYMFNTRVKPFDNPKVRKALSLVIDRQAIIDSFLKAKQQPAFAFVPDGCGGIKTSPKIEKTGDIAKARKLLSEAGFPDGKGLPTIKITYNVSEQHKPIAEAIQQMWKTHLGVEAELYNLSWPAYLAARRNKDFQVARASWVGDFAEPETFLEIFSKDSALNHSGWINEKFDSLLAKARNSKSKAVRLKYLSQAEEILIESAPIIPIYFYSKVYQILPVVKNWHSNLLDYRDYHDVYLEQ